MRKKDLALMYSPEMTPHSAVNRLMDWITNCPVLASRLADTGYTKHQHVFTPAQVALIYEYLGEP